MINDQLYPGWGSETRETGKRASADWHIDIQCLIFRPVPCGVLRTVDKCSVRISFVRDILGVRAGSCWTVRLVTKDALEAVARLGVGCGHDRGVICRERSISRSVEATGDLKIVWTVTRKKLEISKRGCCWIT